MTDRIDADPETGSRAGGGLAAERTAGSFLRDASIEMLPREALAFDPARHPLSAGMRVFVTKLPKASFDDSVAAARRLRALGLEPVPHLPVRGLGARAALAEVLARFRGEADVSEILLIAGSIDQPAGPFADTMAALDTGLVEEAGIRRVNLAGHPEGMPGVPDGALEAALAAKNAHVARSPASFRIVTQFFFEAEPVIAWERAIRARGNRLPVRPGIHGVTSFRALLRHGLACGVGASLKALQRQTASLSDLLMARRPDGLIAALAAARMADPDSLIEAAHFFPLGGLEATLDLIAAAQSRAHAA